MGRERRQAGINKSEIPEEKKKSQKDGCSLSSQNENSETFISAFQNDSDLSFLEILPSGFLPCSLGSLVQVFLVYHLKLSALEKGCFLNAQGCLPQASLG